MTLFAFIGSKLAYFFGYMAVTFGIPFLMGVLAGCITAIFTQRGRKAVLVATSVFTFATLCMWNSLTSTPTYASARAGLFKTYSEFSKEEVKPTVIGLGTELRRFILVSYNPPKHFYVTLKDVETGHVFERVYVSKHCNSHRDNKLGDAYNITISKTAMSDKPADVKWLFPNLYDVFCK